MQPFSTFSVSFLCMTSALMITSAQLFYDSLNSRILSTFPIFRIGNIGRAVLAMKCPVIHLYQGISCHCLSACVRNHHFATVTFYPNSNLDSLNTLVRLSLIDFVTKAANLSEKYLLLQQRPIRSCTDRLVCRYSQHLLTSVCTSYCRKSALKISLRRTKSLYHYRGRYSWVGIFSLKT